MKKVVKIILYVVWGLFTCGFILYGAIQSREAEIQRSIGFELWKSNKELEKSGKKLLEEYYMNLNKIREDSCHNIDIDSIFESSAFLRDYEKSLKNAN